MNSRITPVALSLALVLSTLGCNLGSPAPTSDPLVAAATIVAMTLKAEGVSTSPGSAPSETPSPTSPTASPTAKPTLKVNTEGAECQSGPGPNTDLVASYPAGTQLDLIARDTADDYWLVKDPGSGSSCWIKGQDATAAGSFGLLPEVTPQAIAAENVPAKPGSSSSFNYWEYSCGIGTATVTLRWIDNADDEAGYRIYRLDQMIADLPAGSTTYTDTPTTSGGSLSYSIRAYNAAGESAPLNTPSFSC